MKLPPNFPKVVLQIPEAAGEQYTPSNGTSGDMFMAGFCYRCVHEEFTHRQCGKQCDIMSESLLGNKPFEWQYSSEGWPMCIDWKHWDWGGGKNIPPDPEPEDPGQLLIPFSVFDLFGMDDDSLVVTRTAIFERDLIA